MSQRHKFEETTIGISLRRLIISVNPLHRIPGGNLSPSSPLDGLPRCRLDWPFSCRAIFCHTQESKMYLQPDFLHHLHISAFHFSSASLFTSSWVPPLFFYFLIPPILVGSTPFVWTLASYCDCASWP